MAVDTTLRPYSAFSCLLSKFYESDKMTILTRRSLITGLASLMPVRGAVMPVNPLS
jgi:hypothetical protein